MASPMDHGVGKNGATQSSRANRPDRGRYRELPKRRGEDEARESVYAKIAGCLGVERIDCLQIGNYRTGNLR
jgi:hypothetical protein